MILALQDLKRPSTPNSCLACPVTWSSPQADLQVQIYPVPTHRLRECLVSIVAAEPRSNLLRLDKEARQAEFEQRSRFFGFRDRIIVEFVEIEAERSSLAIYSRSLVGFCDFGANQARVRRWLAALDAKLAQS